MRAFFIVDFGDTIQIVWQRHPQFQLCGSSRVSEVSKHR